MLCITAGLDLSAGISHWNSGLTKAAAQSMFKVEDLLLSKNAPLAIMRANASGRPLSMEPEKDSSADRRVLVYLNFEAVTNSLKNSRGFRLPANQLIILEPSDVIQVEGVVYEQYGWETKSHQCLTEIRHNGDHICHRGLRTNQRIDLKTVAGRVGFELSELP